MDYIRWKSHWEDLVDKFDTEGYENLTPEERVWFNVRSLIDSVENGGVSSFYYNSGVDYLEETIEDLHTLGADDAINILKQINEFFPHEKPPKDSNERNEIINSWEDGKYDELIEKFEEEFSELIEDLETKLEPVIRERLFLKIYKILAAHSLCCE